MASLLSAPFQPGETYGTTDTSVGVHLEGSVWDDDDLSLTDTGVKSRRSGKPRKLMIVRNSATITLAGKRLVRMKAGTVGQVDGYSNVDGQRRVYPVDEYLTSNVAVGDLFYVVVEGTAIVTTDLAGGANNLISAGDDLCALTAAASTSTTAGRVQPINTDQATTPLANEIFGAHFCALSAKTTANTGADILVEVRYH